MTGWAPQSVQGLRSNVSTSSPRLRDHAVEIDRLKVGRWKLPWDGRMEDMETYKEDGDR